MRENLAQDVNESVKIGDQVRWARDQEKEILESLRSPPKSDSSVFSQSDKDQILSL